MSDKPSDMPYACIKIYVIYVGLGIQLASVSTLPTTIVDDARMLLNKISTGDQVYNDRYIMIDCIMYHHLLLFAFRDL